jgi:hypothetical protein
LALDGEPSSDGKVTVIAGASFPSPIDGGDESDLKIEGSFYNSEEKAQRTLST